MKTPFAPPGVSECPKKRLLTAAEAAKYLCLAEWTVRQWASMGRLPKVKLGRSLRFDIIELEKIVEEATISARKPIEKDLTSVD